MSCASRGKIDSTNSTPRTANPAQQIPIQDNARRAVLVSRSDLVQEPLLDACHLLPPFRSQGASLHLPCQAKQPVAQNMIRSYDMLFISTAYGVKRRDQNCWSRSPMDNGVNARAGSSLISSRTESEREGAYGCRPAPCCPGSDTGQRRSDQLDGMRLSTSAMNSSMS